MLAGGLEQRRIAASESSTRSVISRLSLAAQLLDRMDDLARQAGADQLVIERQLERDRVGDIALEAVAL